MTGAANLPGFQAAVAQATVVIDIHDAEPQTAPVTIIELVDAPLPNVSPVTVMKLTPLRGTLIGSKCETTGASNVRPGYPDPTTKPSVTATAIRH